VKVKREKEEEGCSGGCWVVVVCEFAEEQVEADKKIDFSKQKLRKLC